MYTLTTNLNMTLKQNTGSTKGQKSLKVSTYNKQWLVQTLWLDWTYLNSLPEVFSHLFACKMSNPLLSCNKCINQMNLIQLGLEFDMDLWPIIHALL